MGIHLPGELGSDWFSRKFTAENHFWLVITNLTEPSLLTLLSTAYNLVVTVVLTVIFNGIAASMSSLSYESSTTDCNDECQILKEKNF